jgi:gas vesicle protein
MSKGSKLGWILGLLSGTALGVLFAPEKGKNLRKKIKKEGYEPIVDDLKAMGNEMFDSAKEVYEMDEVQKVIKKGKKKLDKKTSGLRKSAKKKIKAVEKKAKSIRKTVQKHLK